jgi:hypothetical protein
VEGDEYLLSLTRYVHLNPVQVGAMQRRPIEERVRYLRQYRWSTYPSYIGRRKAFAFVEYGPMLAEMNGKRSQWPKRYREFVEGGLAEADTELRAALKESPRSIGSERFRAWVDALYQKLVEGHNRPEDIAFRRVTEPLPVETILQVLAELLEVDQIAFRERRRNSALRAVAACMLLRFGGQTQRETAAHLGMGTGGAVSAQVRRLPDLLVRDRRLRRTVSKIEERLASEKREALPPSGQAQNQSK